MNKNKKLNQLFLLLVSIQTILMGIVFIIQIFRIYYGNHQEFTRAICGKYILQILPVIVIWIVLIILSYIYHKLSNAKDQHSIKLTNVGKLKFYEAMCPDYNVENEQYQMLKKENNKRKIAWMINIIVIILCSLMGLLYLINVDHFKSEGNLSLQAIQMTIHLLPWVIISFISLIICLYYEETSSLKSIEIIKVIINQEGKKLSLHQNRSKRNKKLLIIRLSIIVVAVGLIIHGIINGGASDVLQKAINICTECIGLG